MINPRRASVTASTALTLLAALGAGPATQPTAPKPLVIEPQSGVYVSDKAVAAARIITPRKYANGMPNAPLIYVTPRSEWIPKLFNGEWFYIIPCKGDDSRAAAVAPGAVKIERTTAMAPKVNWDAVLTAPTTQPTPAATSNATR